MTEDGAPPHVVLVRDGLSGPLLLADSGGIELPPGSRVLIVPLNAQSSTSLPEPRGPVTVIVGSGQLLDLPGQLRPLWHVASLAAAEDTPKDLLPEGFDDWLTTEGADVGVAGLAQESAESFATEFIRGRFHHGRDGARNLIAP